MNNVLQSLFASLNSSASTFVQDQHLLIDADTLIEKVAALATHLKTKAVQRVGLLADNGVAWIIADLACLEAQICCVPLPCFFSASQLNHAINHAGLDAILCDEQGLQQIKPTGKARIGRDDATGLHLLQLPPRLQPLLPNGTAKITFTSGSTGNPKGVCLSSDNLVAVCNALVTTLQIENPRHLCLLPLSTLLENIAGVYTPLSAGGCVIAPSLSAVGISGSSRLDLGRMLEAINRYQPNTMILIPQLLLALTTACELGWQAPPSLKFIAVGGSRVAPNLLTKARTLGLPVYEGYGLSECASVVTLNTPNDNLIGSTGKTLPHVQLDVDDGELVLRGSTFLGYVNEPDSWYPAEVRSGDIGRVDEQGFVHVTGRLKNVLISSYGRNISPEWVESELLSSPLLSQCVVFGDAKPFCCALIAAREPHISRVLIQKWIDNVNKNLPDYAQIKAWHRLQTPLTAQDGLLTDNGRPKREQIFRAYQNEIEALYIDCNPKNYFRQREA